MDTSDTHTPGSTNDDIARDGRHRRRMATAATLVASVATVSGIALGATYLSSASPAERPDHRTPETIAAYTGPTLLGGQLLLSDVSFDVGPDALSVGQSGNGVVVTSEATPLNDVSIYHPDGTLASATQGIRGIAMTSEDSTIAAWIAPADAQYPQEASRLFVADTATGQVTATADTTFGAQVMAVHGTTVALSDDDHSWLFTVGSGLQPLSFVPNEFFVQDFSATAVLASDLNGQLRIFTRAGAQTAVFSGVVTAALNADGTAMSGIDTGGYAYVSSVASGSQPQRLGNAQGVYAVEWNSADDVVVRSDQTDTPADDERRDVCDPSSATCQNVSDSDPDADSLLPNDALGQLLVSAE